MIPKQTIEEIKQKSDLVALVSDYVALKKRGKNYIGLCPFHSERTPSFTVSPDKSLWHCFGCGEGGTVFDFVMKIEKVDFAESLKILGEKTGVAVEISPQDRAVRDLREKIWQSLELACKFYESRLDSEVGRSFLALRNIDLPTATRFRLGATAPGRESLFKHLLGLGVSPADMEEAGLVLRREGADQYFDRFRERFVFPVMDLRGRVVGFSGRAIGDEEPKYLNSPDTKVFNKGGLLYGLYQAREGIKKAGYVLLVEGNVDLISCFQAGIDNAAAPLGTSFTPEQAALIGRLATKAVIAFDSDNAGCAASQKASAILRQAGVRGRIVMLEGCKDPDECLQKAGRDGFLEYIKKSVPGLEFAIKQTLRKYNLKDREARVAAAHETADLLSRETDAILQKEYLKASSRWLGIDEERLFAEVRQKSSQKKGVVSLKRKVEKPSSNIKQAQRSLLHFALEYADSLPLIRQEVKADDFEDQDLKKIFAHILEGNLAQVEEETLKKIVREIMLESQPVDDLKACVKDCAWVLKSLRIKEESDGLRAQMEKVEKLNDLEGLKKLQQDYHKLSEISRSYER